MVRAPPLPLFGFVRRRGSIAGEAGFCSVSVSNPDCTYRLLEQRFPGQSSAERVLQRGAASWTLTEELAIHPEGMAPTKRIGPKLSPIYIVDKTAFAR
jgi:hypothetical protein